jgi:cytoskeleton protein RodZ
MSRAEDSLESGPISAPPTVGEELRAGRVRLQLSVQDVSQRLKYSARQIEAIERDDYAALPGLTFTRGFVRGYARLVGVDADDAVRRVEKALDYVAEGPSTQQLQSIVPSQPAVALPGKSGSGWPWVLATFVAVVGMGGYALHQWQAPARVVAAATPATPASSATSAGTSAAPEKAADAAVPGGSQPAGTVVSPLATPQALVLGEGVRELPMPQPEATFDQVGKATAENGPADAPIVFRFEGRSWIEVRDATGRVVYSGENMAGAERRVSGKAPFKFVVGNARDVRLSYKGADVDLKPYIDVSVARFDLN